MKILEKRCQNFYVDDLNTSVNSFEEAKVLHSKIKLRFLEASFNVRKWRTNDENLQNYFDIMKSEISSSKVVNPAKIVNLNCRRYCFR